MLFEITSGNQHTLGVKYSNGHSYVAIRPSSNRIPKVQDGALNFYFRSTCEEPLGLSSMTNSFGTYDKVTLRIGVTQCSLGDNETIVSAVYIQIGDDVWVSPVESHEKNAYSPISIDSFVHQD